MIIRYTEEEFHKAKSFDKLKLECVHCQSLFLKEKVYIKYILKQKAIKTKLLYCSLTCKHEASQNRIRILCHNCNTVLIRRKSACKKIHSFCNNKCSGIYSSKNKQFGINRSKLESYLEKELIEFYPDLDFHFNRKDAINSELDIYLPELKLAFELNGIFHYEPIFGQEKLNKIQNNDNRKFQACIEKGIELCIINSSHLTYFKPEKGKKFLEIIKNIINQNISKNKIVRVGLEPTT